MTLYDKTVNNNKPSVTECNHPKMILLEVKDETAECYHVNDTDSYSCDMCNTFECSHKETHYTVRCVECNKKVVLDELQYGLLKSKDMII